MNDHHPFDAHPLDAHALEDDRAVAPHAGGPKPNGRPPIPDEVWARVREDYVAGLSVAACCHRHGMGESTLRNRARLEGWMRQTTGWVPSNQLDAWDEGVILEDDIEGNLDRIEYCQLWYVASRRMMRAVLRGDATAALRWRRVKRMLDEDEAELERMMAQDEAILARRREVREAAAADEARAAIARED